MDTVWLSSLVICLFFIIVSFILFHFPLLLFIYPFFFLFIIYFSMFLFIYLVSFCSPALHSPPSFNLAPCYLKKKKKKKHLKRLLLTFLISYSLQLTWWKHVGRDCIWFAMHSSNIDLHRKWLLIFFCFFVDFIVKCFLQFIILIKILKKLKYSKITLII